MDSQDNDNLKSNVMERNLNQMIGILHLRLNALADAAQTRIKFCEEDLNPNSIKMSKQCPKIADDYEDVNPKTSFKNNKSSGNNKVIFIFISLIFNNK